MGKVGIIGAGLAGCEAAWAAVNLNADVTLFEMKPHEYTPAHQSPLFAELVCSNSLKAMRIESAAGLLKEEMRRLNSVCLKAAEKSAVPAGGALAVDRALFSAFVTEMIKSHPRIRIEHREVVKPFIEGVDAVVIATGPLTSPALSERLQQMFGKALSFYDAAAPIVSADSVDMDYAFYGSRYGKGGEDGDYVNCPLNKQEYEEFHAALINAKTAPLHSFDKSGDIKVYQGCMPIETLAKRGLDAIRFGPMKPVGLTDPRTGRRPWAVVQLRKENLQGTMLNMVGFQTNLTFGEQKRVFSLIPALHSAEFLRYGVMHRNTFLDSPRLLAPSFALKDNPKMFFAGQITGVEGYMESASSGIVAGINAARAAESKPPLILPEDTMIGALAKYISDPEVKDFQPMGANFGLLPPLDDIIKNKQERYAAYAKRALQSLQKAVFELE
ncbi:MAG TPA: methylenetetrahydrofolate--tRNA-(uracil(54)-C(5))-methyltransferase (FADH(2)-oxidizing) TrmFO [Candidatus Avimonas sp.]|jgi:methylenetetrahydrofolate--tRNA-(uracil-5-)-methyltransferase|nr:methylenetetrahydrofolate--tRNA-(uracil(54)-C(5))-methyltransferase (FADH(2)-oxidizing) TrmFO [Clostridiales bacterium]HOB36547.1 methylenetetrahydrofolate--tRNA-(uracil(54)-C(5))-methyltransferase (FADH(2)-oxidizing) TrmFO [Candidatus Avimonas sp.]HQA15451.1 methylenetetrahydrofolate--tRNA-(uracil(54)-C(5))-methyltransferase (FADH(2)-oxidizing) TrmFO [Candidatus Avimonas sp.]HQD37663.1 methylenetetrahydrofolate--tRNA-(uracil(54)-C(5))-methyltransferase (FADH(2)-oxidizing) TrmFO [Candidatus A